MLTKKEVRVLKGMLKAYYLGKKIPGPIVWAYYDRDLCSSGLNPQTMYAEGHSCVKCEVEYRNQPDSILGEDILVAHVTHYHGDGKFTTGHEYWDCKDVAEF